MANEQNLRGPFSPSEAREQGEVGGIASGKARREKKLMIEAYGQFLIGKHKIKVRGEVKELTGWELVDYAIQEGFKKSPVPMLKELRETIDGSKISIVNEIDWSKFSKEEILKLAGLDEERHTEDGSGGGDA